MNQKNINSKTLLILIILGFLASRFLGISPSVEPDKDAYQKGTVVRVVDGDTAKINIGGNNLRVRFTSINTPEYDKATGEGDYYGKEAFVYTKKELEGKTVWLEMDVTDTDHYDRLLRYIRLNPPKDPNNPTKNEIANNLFNGILVKEGYAYSGNYRPDVKYKAYLDEFEKDAKINKRGMWR